MFMKFLTIIEISKRRYQATVKIPLISSVPLVGKLPDSALRCGLIASPVHTQKLAFAAV